MITDSKSSWLSTEFSLGNNDVMKMANFEPIVLNEREYYHSKNDTGILGEKKNSHCAK